MEASTSLICSTCNQQVPLRELRGDGVCKSCSRKQYYQSRKELLAQRYQENREERLAKQKEYYRLKKLRAHSGETESKPSTRGRKKKTNLSNFDQQPQQNVQQTSTTSKARTNKRVAPVPPIELPQPTVHMVAADQPNIIYSLQPALGGGQPIHVLIPQQDVVNYTL